MKTLALAVLAVCSIVTPAVSSVTPTFDPPQQFPDGGTSVRRVRASLVQEIALGSDERVPISFANDGNADVVESDGPTLTIRRGDESGSAFENFVLDSTSTPPLSDYVVDFAVADLNGDSLPDIVVLTNLGKLVVYLNTFDADPTTNPQNELTFADGVTYTAKDAMAANVSLNSVTVGSLDGSLPVLIGAASITDAMSNKKALVAVFPQVADQPGVFDNNVVFQGAGGGDFIAVGDLDADGFPEVVTASYNASKVTVFPNYDAGGARLLADETTVGSPAPITASINLPLGLALGDVTGDSNRDILVYDRTFSGGVTHRGLHLFVYDLANNQMTSYGSLNLSNLAADVPIAHLELGDLNGDGQPDVVVSNPFDGRLEIVLINAGLTDTNHVLTAATPINVTTAAGTNAFDLADFDQDTKLDLFTANSDTNNQASLLRNSTGEVEEPLSDNIVEFEIPAQTVVEGVPAVQARVRRSSASTGTLTVPFSVGGTAKRYPKPHSDFDIYLPEHNTLIFPDNGPDQFQQYITIFISQDVGPEAPDTIILTLGKPKGDGRVGKVKTHIITIKDSEKLPIAAAGTLKVTPSSRIKVTTADGVKVGGRTPSAWKFETTQTTNKDAAGLKVKVQFSFVPPPNEIWINLANMAHPPGADGLPDPKSTKWIATSMGVPVCSKLFFRTVSVADDFAETGGETVGPFKVVAAPVFSLGGLFRSPSDPTTPINTFAPGPLITHENDQLTYRFSFKNVGAAPATNVVLSAIVPSNSRYLTATTGSGATGTIEEVSGKINNETRTAEVRWHFASIAPNQNCFVDMVVTVFGPADFGTNPNAGLGRNVSESHVTISCAEGIDRAPFSQGDLEAVIHGPLELKLTNDRSVAKGGDVIVYTFKCTNTSGTALPGAKVTDLVPPNTTLAYVYDVDGTGNATTTLRSDPNATTNPAAIPFGDTTQLTWDLGTIPAVTTRTLKFAVRIPYDISLSTQTGPHSFESTRIVNDTYDLSAVVAGQSVSALYGLAAPVVGSAVTGGEPNDPPKLGLIKYAVVRGPLNDGSGNAAGVVLPDGEVGAVVSGKTTDYQLIYENSGNVPAHRLRLHDVLPKGITLVANGNNPIGFFTTTSGFGLNLSQFTFYNAGGKIIPSPSVTAANIGTVRSFDINLGTLLANHGDTIQYTVRAIGKVGTAIHSFGGFDAKAGISAKNQGFYLMTGDLVNTVPNLADGAAHPGATPEDVVLLVVAPAAITAGIAADQSSTSEGGVLSYTVNYVQVGGVPAANALIQIPFPPGTSLDNTAANPVEFLDANKAHRAPGAGESIDTAADRATFHLGTFAPGAFGKLRVHLTVANPLPADLLASLIITPPMPQGNFTVAASNISALASRAAGTTRVAGTEPATAFLDLTRNHFLTPIRKPHGPQMVLGCIAPLSVKLGPQSYIIYTLFFANLGDRDVTDYGIAMQFPYGTQYFNANGGEEHHLVTPGSPDATVAPCFSIDIVHDKKRSDSPGFKGDDQNIIVWRNHGTLAPGAFGAVSFAVFVDPYIDVPSVTEDSAVMFASNANSATAGTIATTIVHSNFFADAWDAMGNFFSGIGGAVTGGNHSDLAGVVKDLGNNSKVISTGLADNLQILNGVNFIRLRNGRAMIVAAGGGNVISNDGGSIVAAGGGNLLNQDGSGIVATGGGNVVMGGSDLIVKNIPSLGTLTGAKILDDPLALINAKAANILAGGAENLITGQGTSIVSHDGGTLVPVVTHFETGAAIALGSSLNNLLLKGGGNIVAAGGGNILANDGATIVATGGGNVVASGAGNVVGTAGGSVIGNTSAGFSVTGGAQLLKEIGYGVPAVGK